MSQLSLEPVTIGEIVEESPEMNNGMLSKVTRGRRPQPRRMLIYGVHGVGKSSFAACAPKPIFVPTEDGTNDLDVNRFPLCTSLTEFRSCLVSLLNEKHDYQTAVIDSLDWLEKLIHLDVCREYGVKAIGDVDYGKGYVAASKVFHLALDVFQKLHAAGMHIVLVAHSKDEMIRDADHEPYLRHSLDMHKLISSTVLEWCDEVFFCNYEVHTTSTKTGFNQEHVRAVGGQRMIFTNHTATSEGKCRIPGVPAKLPLNGQEYFTKFLGVKQ